MQTFVRGDRAVEAPDAAPAAAGPAAGPRAVVARAGGGRAVVLALAVAVLALLVLASLGLGVRAIAPGQVWQALVDPASGVVDHQVVREQRLPRTLIGVLAGAALGVAGLLGQAITRNPLADPGLLGLNAGAAVGIVAAAVFAGVGSPLASVWFAFAGAALAAVVVFAVGRGEPVRLALAGAAVTALLVPLTTLLLLRDVAAFEQLRAWSVGALTARGPEVITALAPLVLLGLVLALPLARRLDGLALGDDVARALGQSVGLTRGVASLAIVLLAGTATALAGPIALVGLAVPHAARRLVGLGHRWLLPLCAVLGAALLLLADVAGRFLAAGELEAGVVAALLGAPVLVAVARGRRVAGL